jgi:hypothetical protein
MPKFPVDAPKVRVLRTLAALGFELVREREHIALQRRNADGSLTSLTLPNHPRIKGSTMRTIRNQADISRQDFIEAYERC